MPWQLEPLPPQFAPRVGFAAAYVARMVVLGLEVTADRQPLVHAENNDAKRACSISVRAFGSTDIASSPTLAGR